MSQRQLPQNSKSREEGLSVRVSVDGTSIGIQPLTDVLGVSVDPKGYLYLDVLFHVARDNGGAVTTLSSYSKTRPTLVLPTFDVPIDHSQTLLGEIAERIQRMAPALWGQYDVRRDSHLIIDLFKKSSDELSVLLKAICGQIVNDRSLMYTALKGAGYQINTRALGRYLLYCLRNSKKIESEAMLRLIMHEGQYLMCRYCQHGTYKFPLESETTHMHDGVLMCDYDGGVHPKEVYELAEIPNGPWMQAVYLPWHECEGKAQIVASGAAGFQVSWSVPSPTDHFHIKQINVTLDPVKVRIGDSILRMSMAAQYLMHMAGNLLAKIIGARKTSEVYRVRFDEYYNAGILYMMAALAGSSHAEDNDVITNSRFAAYLYWRVANSWHMPRSWITGLSSVDQAYKGRSARTIDEFERIIRAEQFGGDIFVAYNNWMNLTLRTAINSRPDAPADEPSFLVTRAISVMFDECKANIKHYYIDAQLGWEYIPQ